MRVMCDRTVIGDDDDVETVVETSLEAFNQRRYQTVNVRQHFIHLTINRSWTFCQLASQLQYAYSHCYTWMALQCESKNSPQRFSEIFFPNG